MAERKQPPQDVYALRRIKKRKRLLKRIGLFALISTLLLAVYVNRDFLMSKLRDLTRRHHSVQSNGSLSGGNFPLSVYGGISYQSDTISDLLLILGDAYLYLYQTNGELLESRQHAYGSAMLQAAGDYALVYENGGTRFRLETENQTLYEKTISDKIIFGRVSEDGYTALVTTSDTSACKLIVFDRKGKQIYLRSCVKELVEIAFTKDSGGCYAVSIHTDNGVMKSVVHSYDFQSEKERWVSQPLDMLCISVYNTDGGEVFVLGDVSCSYLDAGGAVLSTYVYPDTLVRGDYADGIAAILLRNDEKRTNTVAMLGGAAAAPVLLDFDTEVKDVAVSDHSVTVQTRAKLETWTIAGQLLAESEIADTYDSFLPVDSYLFLMGYNRIDRLEY
ncbi:MAG: hypothetical protein IKM30_08205 [Oscillospiraceae bacterium]|nr:hypothetical protein [Oscillospiraceae bacterium]